MENNDNIDIAALAHQSNMWLNSKQIRDASRIDPRRFFQPNGGQPQYPYPQQQQPHYPPYPQPYYPPQQPNFNGGVNEYGLPESIPVNNIQIPLIARDKDGNPIDLTQAPSVAGQLQPQSYPSQINQGMNDVRGFQIPDYSKYNTPSFASEKTSVNESTLEIILREIKSLKKAINKLIRESERTKLPLAKTTNLISDNNEVNDQSTIISEGICSTDSGNQ